MKSTLDSQRQKTSIPTVEDIGDLINKKERYQDAEKKIKEMLNNGYNISDRDEGNNNLLHLIAVLPKGKKIYTH
ncbi:MAG: hypothetical protein KTV77_03800 [Wolbachia endosymbiont of Fragariocoptes setiger]|nr:hypothetical protein [Wolbachia endosymbiont of Fragariocoptes setiger]